MMIPPEKIQEILERTDIVELVSRHVELKRSGRSFKGLCPFHNEKGASFHVTPHMRRFKCFGCEAGGDAITFVQRIEGKSFVEAARSLAKQAGVEIEEREDPLAKERAQLFEANSVACRHFEERLWTDPRARPGRDHLEARGVSEKVARAFSLGYALNNWNDLTAVLVRDGILDWGVRSGLCAARTKGDGYYDVFRGRLMVPIRSPEGRTVGFGARLVEETARPDGDKGPKYLNSRESQVYRKSETLYAMDLARDEIRRTKTAILVEGYFDAIGLHAAGVKNSVALCSTALTAGHMQLLQRHDTHELVLLLDGDEAGMKAVERLSGAILAAGLTARVAALPEGDDPDTFATREGKSAVEKLIAGAPPLTVHLLDRALPKGRASAWEEKVSALSRLSPVLEQMPVGMGRTLFINQMAEHLGVAEGDIKAHLVQAEAAKPHRVSKPAEKAAPAPQKPSPSRALDHAEAMLAAVLIAHPELRGEPEARFVDEIHAVEVRMLLESENPQGGVAALPELLRKQLEAKLAEVARTMGGPEHDETRRKALADASRTLRLSRVEERIKDKNLEIRQAEAQDLVADELERLQRELMELNSARNRLKNRLSAPNAGISR